MRISPDIVQGWIGSVFCSNLFKYHGILKGPDNPCSVIIGGNYEGISGRIQGHLPDLIKARAVFCHWLEPCPYPVPVAVDTGITGRYPHIIMPAPDVLDSRVLEELLIADGLVIHAVEDLDTPRVTYPEISFMIIFDGGDKLVHQSLRDIIMVDMAG